MESEGKQKGFFELVNSKTAFGLGIVTTIGVMAIIGFIVILGMYLSDGDTSKKTSKTNVNTNVNSPQQPTNVAPSAEDVPGVDADSDLIRGNKNAKVSIIEYSDLDCPFCSSVHGTLKQIVDEFDGEVNWVYRHFPLTSLHPNAAKKAEAVECARKLEGNDAAWDFIDELFVDQKGYTPSNIGSAADKAGIDGDAVQECMNSGEARDVISEHYGQVTAAGGQGTPYSIIVSGDTQLPISGALPFESFKSAIEGVM